MHSHIDGFLHNYIFVFCDLEFVHIWMGNEKPESDRTTAESEQEECVREVVVVETEQGL